MGKSKKLQQKNEVKSEVTLNLDLYLKQLATFLIEVYKENPQILENHYGGCESRQK